MFKLKEIVQVVKHFLQFHCTGDGGRWPKSVVMLIETTTQKDKKRKRKKSTKKECIKNERVLRVTGYGQGKNPLGKKCLGFVALIDG